VADLFEWNETVAYDEEAPYVGSIAGVEEGGVHRETLPKPYWQCRGLFEEKKAKRLAARRTFNHVINLKEGAEHPWGLIYLMSAQPVTALDKYVKKMRAKGKITDSESP